MIEMFGAAVGAGVFLFLGRLYFERRNKTFCETCDGYTKSMYRSVNEGGGRAPLYAEQFCSECKESY